MVLVTVVITVHASRKCNSIIRQLFLVFVLASLSIVTAIEVSPDDTTWRSSVEEAPTGSIISFLAGVYIGCNIALPAGVTLAAKHSLSCPPGSASSMNCTANVTIDCKSNARYLHVIHHMYTYDAGNKHARSGISSDEISCVSDIVTGTSR